MRNLVRKLLLVALSASLLSFGVLAPAVADEEQPAEEPQAEQPVDNVVTVGIFAFDGYHMRDDEGNLTGYGIELLKMLERYSHLNFRMVGYDCSWSDMLDMLASGEIDMVTSARLTTERSKQFAFSLPVGINKTVLSIASDNNSIVANNYKTYNGMRVGVLAGSSQNELMKSFAAEKGFTCEIVEFDDSERLTRALQSGRVDAVLTSNLRRSDNERPIDTLAVDDFYAIVRKGDTDLLNELNYAIEQMDLHEGDWKNVLYYRFYGPKYSSALEFTQREQAYIDQVKAGEKAITVTALTDRRPYSYMEDGQLKGIMLDYFAAVMAVAGMPYEVVSAAGSEDYLTQAELENVDIVLDAMVDDDRVSIGEEGSNGFVTEPYMHTSFAVVTRTDFDGTPQTVAVADGQTAGLVRQYLPEGAEVVRYTTPEAAMRAVADDEVDAAYVYAYAAQLYVNQDSSGVLHYSIANELGADFAMFVRDSADHELVNVLDKCIQRVPQSKLDQLVTEYIAYDDDDPSFEEFVRANPVMTAVAGLGFLLIVLAVLALVMRDNWNRRLLRAKEESNRELGEQLAIVDALSRDYTNVFAVNADRGAVKIIKLEGYVTEGLEKDADVEFPYTVILGNYIKDRVFPEDKRRLARELALDTVREKLSEADEYLGIYRILDEEGEVHHYQYAYTFLDDGAGDSFILAGFRNIDETIRNEQEQRALLAEALTKAQYASRSKTAFLNNMSHDIRTPMNAIIGFTALAGEHLDEPKQIQDYLNKINTSSSHLLSLINDVLDMSRIESGKVKIEEQETNLHDILHDLKTIVQPDIKEKSLRFSIGMVGVQNATVVCDRLRLNQVLLNILNNAMKYTKPGGRVSLAVMQTSEVENGRADYEFRIKDTGIGMSAEFLEHVFEPFERESTATVSGIQGTGLGLAITKNIVDMMGADISVTSEQGKGSEFTVSASFPVVEGAAPAEKPPAPKGSWPSASDKSPEEMRFDGKRILLVEDNELNLEIAQAILERAGFTVDTADDGTVAVEKMDEMPPGTYDLILTDVQMPHMDGYEETRIIRTMHDLRKATVPIVAMTANAFEEDREKAASAGMNGYVCKPINVKELMKVLGDILR